MIRAAAKEPQERPDVGPCSESRGLVRDTPSRTDGEVTASADGLKAVAVRARVGVAVTAEALVAVHPVPGEDRGGQGDLPGERRAGADLGELMRLALAVAAEQLEALTLRGRAVPPP